MPVERWVCDFGCGAGFPSRHQAEEHEETCWRRLQAERELDKSLNLWEQRRQARAEVTARAAERLLAREMGHHRDSAALPPRKPSARQAQIMDAIREQEKAEAEVR